MMATVSLLLQKNSYLTERSSSNIDRRIQKKIRYEKNKAKRLGETYIACLKHKFKKERVTRKSLANKHDDQQGYQNQRKNAKRNARQEKRWPRMTSRWPAPAPP